MSSHQMNHIAWNQITRPPPSPIPPLSLSSLVPPLPAPPSPPLPFIEVRAKHRDMAFPAGRNTGSKTPHLQHVNDFVAGGRDGEGEEGRISTPEAADHVPHGDENRVRMQCPEVINACLHARVRGAGDQDEVGSEVNASVRDDVGLRVKAERRRAFGLSRCCRRKLPEQPSLSWSPSPSPSVSLAISSPHKHKRYQRLGRTHPGDPADISARASLHTAVGC